MYLQAKRIMYKALDTISVILFAKKYSVIKKENKFLVKQVLPL